MSDKTELTALSLKDEINANHRECLRAGNEAIKHAYQAGELLNQVKALLKSNGHPPFGKWVSQFLDPSERTVQRYMKLYNDLRELPKATRVSLFDSSKSLTSIAKEFTKPKPTPKPAPKPQAVSPPQPTVFEPDDEPEADDVVPIHDKRPTTKKAAKPDLGKCPNCAGAKWTETGDGWVCGKCDHPHGEPTGGADDDRVATQRSKTVKTAEALMRAFDDLQTMLAKPEHSKAIKSCKELLTIAKSWK